MSSSTNNEAIKNCKEKYKNNDYNNCIINIKPTQNTETLKPDETIKHLNSKLSNDNKLLPQTNILINEDCETKLNKIRNIITNEKEEQNNNPYIKTRSNTSNTSIKKIEDIKEILNLKTGGKPKPKSKSKTKKKKNYKKKTKTRRKNKRKRNKRRKTYTPSDI